MFALGAVATPLIVISEVVEYAVLLIVVVNVLVVDASKVSDVSDPVTLRKFGNPLPFAFPAEILYLTVELSELGRFVREDPSPEKESALTAPEKVPVVPVIDAIVTSVSPLVNQSTIF